MRIGYWILSMCILGFAVLPADPLASQSSDRRMGLPLEDYFVQSFDTRHGLPVGEVRDVEQAADGYLYAATARGLARFDGRRFEPVSLAPLENPIVDELHVDRSGRLWVLTGGLDVGVLDGGGFRLVGNLAYRDHTMEPELADPDERAIYPHGVTDREFAETPDGFLWLGGLTGLFRIDPSDSAIRRYTRSDGLPGDSTAGLFVLDNGEEVVLTNQGLARRTSPESDEAPFVSIGPRFPDRLYTNVHARQDHLGLWVTLDSTVLRYQEGRTRSYPTSGGENRFRLTRQELGWRPGWQGNIPRVGGLVPPELVPLGGLVRQDGQVWISVVLPGGTNRLLRERGGELEAVRLPRAPPFERVWDLFDDHEQSLWIATDRGLIQLVQRTAAVLPEEFGLGEAFTTAVMEDDEGTVWAGTWGQGLHAWDYRGRHRHYALTSGLPNDRVRTLLEAGDGNLYVGTASGVVAFREGEPFRTWRTDSEVRDLAEDEEGSLWMVTQGGLFRLTDSSWVDRTPRFDRPGELWTVHPGGDGSVWLGGEVGLLRVWPDSARSFDDADGLLNGFVVAIHEASDGTLWFSTFADGIHRYHSGRFTPVTTTEGLLHNGVWSWVEDGIGGVWMSSDRGVFRVGLADLQAVADRIENGEVPPEPLEPLVLTAEDGMPGLESNRASPAGWRLADGRLAFNSMNGVAVVNPHRATAAYPASRTVIDSVAVDGKVTRGDPRALTVHPTPRHIVVNFRALSFAFPDQTRYRYRMDGYDEDWIEGITYGAASYTNLPPGEYTFRVHAYRQGDSRPGTEARLAVTIPPAAWQTTWFRALALTAIVGLLASVHRARVARVVALERLRQRIAADLHDDVGSRLSAIALLSDMTERRSGTGPGEPLPLKRIRATAEHTVDALRDVIWSVDPDRDRLGDLIERMRQASLDLLNGIEQDFVVDPDVPLRTLSLEFRRNVYLFYKEALQNVIKHSGAERVKTEISVVNGVLRVSVLDDGRGFDPAEVDGGYGLANMRRRGEAVGGTTVIRRRPEGGIEVSFVGRMS